MAQEKIKRWDEVHGKDASADTLEVFLDSRTDCYAILQLRHTEETRDEQFASYEWLRRQGKESEIDHYEVVYTAPLPVVSSLEDTLESLYVTFNLHHPSDFTGHSLSVSDIVALKVENRVSSYYVDSIGFVELPGFLSARNPLRSLEDSLEQNDNQLDGMVNNLPEPAYRSEWLEQEKTSVLEQLKEQSGKVRTGTDPERRPDWNPAERTLE
ncbi:MAG: YodL domain-containing protein [Lachnospiraceae bacterium]